MKRTLTRILSACLAALLLCVAPVRAAETDDLLKDMSTEDKISQMIMPAFRYYTDEDGTRHNLDTLTDDVADMLARHGFAGVAFFAQNAADTALATRLVDAMQRANASRAGHPQLLTAIDQEGGRVTRLGQGTQMPGNMALGATQDAAAAAASAEVMGRELAAIGFNFNFAPVVDMNSNPENPVIGLRSFSDDPALTAELGVAFMRALQGTGTVSALKHFPGHGDTATDSHTGLPRIDKTYEELKANELVPFQACIDAGADVVMTAHIQYPAIETQTVTSAETGEEIYLPATLSRTILTDILRGDMGFEGVIITDAMEMDAIARHFGALDAARLAIEAGVDILLMPVDTSTPAGLAALDQYIADLAAVVDDGKIDPAKVDAAVTRILALKERKGLLAPYESADIEARVQTAVDFVGSAANHEVEWGVAKRAVTLVKNESGVLPLATAGKTTVVLTMYDNEVLSMEYAVGRLRDEGKLRADADVRVYSTQKQDAATVMGWIADADHVVCVTETGSVAAMDPNDAKGAYSVALDGLTDAVHARGGDVTILSCSLPYDAARYQAADAIALAWSARGMSEDPRSKENGVAQYGPNMPAALYLLLSPDETPSGTLPVDLPALDEAYGFSDSVLYARGSGLRYDAVPQDASAPIERAQAVALLWRMAGSPGSDAAAQFADVPADASYAAALAWASEQGIVLGTGGGQFSPDAALTWEQAAVMLHRLACAEGSAVAGDAGESWSAPALAWAGASGISAGETQLGDALTWAQLSALAAQYRQLANAR